jgi:hypothetical protein
MRWIALCELGGTQKPVIPGRGHFREPGTYENAADAVFIGSGPALMGIPE